VEILVITTMRNEGPHCLEWIAHHLAAGVGHFLIYTNDCDDGTDAIMEALAGAGLVTHERLRPAQERPVQWQALRHASSHPRVKAADWALVLDCDEFINLRAPLTSLQELIARLPEGADALAMAWRLFGNSGHVHAAEALTTERFTRAAPEDVALPLAHFVKSLFRPARFRQLGVHRPKRRRGEVPLWVDGSGRPLPPGFAEACGRINLFGLSGGRDLVQLNHYALRSAEEFMAKRRRGLPNRMSREVGLGYWVERNFNTVEDASIRRMLPATRRRLEELLAIEGIEALQAQSRAHHRAGLARQLKDEAENRLFLQLAMSAGSRAPDPAFVRAHVRRLAEAQNGNG
jgi:hypothetical protein